jgi:hypothetical protein
MGDNKSGKNGYEIRETLLGMAIGILSDRDGRLRENEYLKPEGTRQPIDGYTVEEVIDTAESLYQFIQKK